MATAHDNNGPNMIKTAYIFCLGPVLEPRMVHMDETLRIDSRNVVLELLGKLLVKQFILGENE